MDYTLFSDEELCVKAKEGESKAFDVLIDRYKRFVNKVAREHFLCDGDFNDLSQEGMIGLLKAIYTFSGKAPFKNYCLKSIKNNVYSAIRKSNAEKNKPLNGYISISGYGDDENDPDKSDIVISYDEPLTGYVENESLEELKENLKTVLSKYEYKILTYYLDGGSYEEIGKAVGKPVKSIDNAIQRIRKKIREKILS